MNPFEQLNRILQEQKTVSTKKLLPIIIAINKINTQQAQKINGQKNKLNKLQTKYQVEKSKAEKRKALVEDYENLKRHHRNLTNEYKLLLAKLKAK